MKEYFKYIGANAHYRVNGLIFEVTMIDVKKSYGVVLFEIKPVSGIGSKWVAMTSLGLPEDCSLRGFNQPIKEGD